MVSESPAKDIVPRARCTENTSDSTEKRIKTTPKHIRFSPPMSNGTPELRKVSYAEKLKAYRPQFLKQKLAIAMPFIS